MVEIIIETSEATQVNKAWLNDNGMEEEVKKGNFKFLELDVNKHITSMPTGHNEGHTKREVYSALCPYKISGDFKSVT